MRSAADPAIGPAGDVDRGERLCVSWTLLYRESGRRTWVNTLPDACPGLRSDAIPVFKIYGSQLCKGDNFETIDRGSGFRGASCRLGDFVPYDKPGK
jgi:hypothetical protein